MGRPNLLVISILVVCYDSLEGLLQNTCTCLLSLPVTAFYKLHCLLNASYVVQRQPASNVLCTLSAEEPFQPLKLYLSGIFKLLEF